jgi:cell division protein FtsQ
MSRRAALAVARTPSRRAALSLPTGAVWRALAIALCVFAAIAVGYLAARQTSLFAVQTIKVSGTRRDVAREVRAALTPYEGMSLVAIDPEDVERTLAAVPVVRSAHVDRAFPHTLKVRIQAERPLAVYRSGTKSWVVSRTGRVLAAIKPNEQLELPRIKAEVKDEPKVGQTLGGTDALNALLALQAVPQRLPGKVLYAQVDAAGVTLILAGARLEIRIGEPRDLEAKLAAAVAVLRALPDDEVASVGYVDVSLPERAVTGPVAQPSSETLESDQ